MGIIYNPSNVDNIGDIMGAENIGLSGVGFFENETGAGILQFRNLDSVGAWNAAILIAYDSGNKLVTAEFVPSAINVTDLADIASGQLVGRNTAGAGAIETLSYATVKTAMSLNLVENTALSTWAGTTSITTLGTISTGVWQGTAVGVNYGGTGATSASGARSALGLTIGTDILAFSASLASLGALGSAADKMVYTTALNTWAEFSTTSFGRGLLNVADAAALRVSAGLGTISTQDSDSVNIDGGEIDGVSAGSNAPLTDLQVDNIKIDGNTISAENVNGNLALSPNGSGAVQADSCPLEFDEISAPSTPASGKVYLYALADGLLYSKDDAGVETPLGGGSGIPGGADTQVQYNSSGSFAGDSGFTYDGAGNLSVSFSFQVGNLLLSGNSLESTDTDGNIELRPNGVGYVDLPGNASGDGSLRFGQDPATSSYGVRVHPPTSALDGEIDFYFQTTGGLIYSKDGGTPVAVADGGSGATSASGARSAFGLIIGTDVQAYSTKLQALSSLTWAANKLFMMSGASSLTTLDVLDEDDMASDSATAVSTQQAIKAYVDSRTDITSALSEKIFLGMIQPNYLVFQYNPSSENSIIIPILTNLSTASLPPSTSGAITAVNFATFSGGAIGVGMFGTPSAFPRNCNALMTMAAPTTAVQNGDRTSAITVTSSITFAAGTLSNLVNGNSTTDDSSNSLDCTSVSVVSGDYIQFDFGSGNRETPSVMTIYRSSAANWLTWSLYGSNDLSNWKSIIPVISIFNPATTTVALTFGSYTQGATSGVDYEGYRYIRLVKTNGSASLSGWLREIVFTSVSNPVADDCTWETVSYTRNNEPNMLAGGFSYSALESITLNTDIKLYVSRDDGSTYTQLTLIDRGDHCTPPPYDSSSLDRSNFGGANQNWNFYMQDAGVKLASSDLTDISGQPSGSDIRLKITTHNNKKIRVYGLGAVYE